MDDLTRWILDFAREVLTAYLVLGFKYYLDNRKRQKKKPFKSRKRKR